MSVETWKHIDQWKAQNTSRIWSSPGQGDTKHITKHPYAKAGKTAQSTVELVVQAPQPLLRNEGVYTTTVNIYDHRVVQKVCENILEAEVTIIQWELLLLAPEIRMQVTDATARQRITRMNAQAPLEFTDKKEHTAEVHMLAAFSAAAMQELPADTTIFVE